MAIKTKNKKQAILLVESSEQNANIYWATKFLAHDPVIFIQTPDNRKILMTTILEIDRAKKQAKVDEVIDILKYSENKESELSLTNIIPAILNDLKINAVIVPRYFWCQISEILKNNGFFVQIKQEPFFKQRMIKTEQEIDNIISVQRAIEDVLQKTLDIIIKSKIKDNLLYFSAKRDILDSEKPLTSEYLRNFIRIELLKRECWCEANVIVSCGKQTSMPHTLGTGQLTANSPIILDIYPRSIETRYWADMTRTVVRGKASNKFKRLYQTVLTAQKKAIAMIKPGIDGSEIDTMIRDYFKSQGYKTGKINGKEQGFIHSTGHGVGLDIHEYPVIYKKNKKPKWILKPGNVITIEPGLYYEKIGGARIEDLLVVTKDGYKNLTRFPKRLMEL